MTGQMFLHRISAMHSERNQKEMVDVAEASYEGSVLSFNLLKWSIG